MDQDDRKFMCDSQMEQGPTIRSLFVVVFLQSALVGEGRLKSRFLEFSIKFVVDHKNRYQPVNSSLDQRLIPLASSTEEPELC